MDELTKLLENAGLPEGINDLQSESDAEDVLNTLSRFYQFEITAEGIDVYTEEDDFAGDEDEPEAETSTRWIRIARFLSFDDMLHDFGKM